ncbi:YceI family protein [Paracoccus sanguinis]|uniref:YceI family protein n=1 Tax=Paracoccus sanguinis TaxID=1545044 RepID=UPI0009DDDCF3|nr:YceI family protein [Paracoccus sanguinis]
MTALHALSPAAHALRSTALAALLGCALSGAALAQAAPAAPAAPATTEAPAAGAGATDASATPASISGTYVFDPEHSQIVFSYNHLGLSTSRGVINGVTGTVTLDEADPTKSKVEASFPLSAIRTVAPALDAHLLSDDFFKGQTPDTRVTFVSTEVVRGDDDEAKVTGDLTLNGVTRPVTLEVEITEAGAHPMTGKPVAGFDIEGKINRSDFGLGAFVPAVSDEISFDIAVEAGKG